ERLPASRALAPPLRTGVAMPTREADDPLEAKRILARRQIDNGAAPVAHAPVTLDLAGTLRAPEQPPRSLHQVMLALRHGPRISSPVRITRTTYPYYTQAWPCAAALAPVTRTRRREDTKIRQN